MRQALVGFGHRGTHCRLTASRRSVHIPLPAPHGKPPPQNPGRIALLVPHAKRRSNKPASEDEDGPVAGGFTEPSEEELLTLEELQRSLEDGEALEDEDLGDIDLGDFDEAAEELSNFVDVSTEEDEGALDEAAEADRGGAAAGDVGDPSTSYGELPERIMPACDVFGEAAFFEAALWLKSRYPDVLVTGIQSNPFLVVPGDIFVLHPGLLPEPEEEQLAAAVGRCASVMVVAEATRGGPPPDIDVPGDIPVIRVEDPMEVGSKLAVAFYGAPSREMVTVSVLGDKGKTTTCWLIRGLLEELGQVVGMAGSIEHAISEDRLDEDGYLWEPLEEDPSEGRECSVPFKLVPYAGKYEHHYGALLPGVNAQKLLAGMKDRGATVAVVECEAESIAFGTWEWLDTNVMVITNLGNIAPPPAPSSEGGEADAAAKAERPATVLDCVLAQLEDLQDRTQQMVVLNIDDPAAPQVLEALQGRVPIFSYSRSNKAATVCAEDVRNSIWETELIVKTPTGRLQIITGLLGEHNVHNVLCAIATGVALKAPLQSIVAGIEAVEIIPGRSEVIDEGQAFSVVVDAAKTPEALKSMLDAARNAGARQVFAVFGCSGEEDPSLRPRMGAVAHNKADFVLLTNENPRREDPAKIMQDIVAGFPDDLINRYSAYAYAPFQDQGRTPLWFEPYLQKAQRDNKRYVMEDRYSAIRAAIGTAGPDDVVLVLGKGHEDWVEHMDEDGDILKGWLDDRVEVRNALAKLKYLDDVKLQRDTLPWGPRLESMMESLAMDPRPYTKIGEA